MEKRYQVFISSTFQDLQNARQEVSQALLRADCFPAGMELFPAADEEQFEFIKTVIDQSDYYIIISAGRYGSIHPETELSYTEMEYDYAVKTGKPVIRLLHKNPKSLETEGDLQFAKLLNFREKMKRERMVAFWETPDQLGKEVSFALLLLTKQKPAIGWVRGNRVASDQAEKQIDKLEKRVAQLKLEINESSISSLPVEKIIHQMSGDFEFTLVPLEATERDERLDESIAKPFLTVLQSHVCESIISQAHSHILEDRIFDLVCLELCTGLYDHEEFKISAATSDKFRQLLHWLEGNGLFDSRVVADGQNYQTEWHLAREARRWVSRMRAQAT